MLHNSKLFAESWNVAWRKVNYTSILNDKELPFKIIKNSFRYWAADPFLFENNGKVYVFAELYDYIRRRGTLGYYCLSEQKHKWHQVIVESYHMSYPYIFRKGNDIFIMPEASASGQLYLYRAVQFPDQWEKYSVLRADVCYADTTPFTINDKEYALAYDVADSQNYQLVLLDMEQKDSDMVLPISDIDMRRPAGKVNSREQIRPAQDCFNDYGKALVFYKFTATEDGTYFEEKVTHITPNELKYDGKIYLDGMHTYNKSGNYEVIDIKTRRFSLLNLCFRMLNKMKH